MTKMPHHATLLSFWALALLATALPQHRDVQMDIVERQAGPIGVIPEIIMVAVVDGAGPAVEAFGLGGQITSALFGDLDQKEPYVGAPERTLFFLSLMLAKRSKTREIAE